MHFSKKIAEMSFFHKKTYINIFWMSFSTILTKKNFFGIFAQKPKGGPFELTKFCPKIENFHTNESGKHKTRHNDTSTVY